MNPWTQQLLNSQSWDWHVIEICNDIARGIKPTNYEPPIEKLRREEMEKRARRAHGKAKKAN